MKGERARRGGRLLVVPALSEVLREADAIRPRNVPDMLFRHALDRGDEFVNLMALLRDVAGGKGLRDTV
jgi:hypothetical protein